MRAVVRAAALTAAVLWIGGCDLPRDPEGTLPRVRGGTLRAGAIHCPPWVSIRDGQVAGVEVELVRSLARELGAEVRWVPGNAEELLVGLERYELDLVVGGITRHTPWHQRVALTRTYHTTRLVVGGPVGALPVEDLTGRPVAVRRGDVVAAALVRERGGTAVEIEDPAAEKLPVAAEAWRVHAWGLKSGDLTLRTCEHVLAAPPGENGWLVHLDRFLHRARADVPGLLEAEAKR
jgi:polar amino acid transport system substrate-binding protein